MAGVEGQEPVLLSFYGEHVTDTGYLGRKASERRANKSPDHPVTKYVKEADGEITTQGDMKYSARSRLNEMDYLASQGPVAIDLSELACDKSDFLIDRLYTLSVAIFHPDNATSEPNPLTGKPRDLSKVQFQINQGFAYGADELTPAGQLDKYLGQVSKKGPEREAAVRQIMTHHGLSRQKAEDQIKLRQPDLQKLLLLLCKHELENEKRANAQRESEYMGIESAVTPEPTYIDGASLVEDINGMCAGQGDKARRDAKAGYITLDEARGLMEGGKATPDTLQGSEYMEVLAHNALPPVAAPLTVAAAALQTGELQQQPHQDKKKFDRHSMRQKTMKRSGSNPG